MIPHEDIRKDGNENKNYLMLFTASWCHYCPAQKQVVATLKADYIVYEFDTDQYQGVARLMNVRSIPCTVIMDKGKEVKRFEGVTSAKTLKQYLKTRKEQDWSL